MATLMLNRIGDRPPTPGEIGQFLRRKLGTRGRFESFTRAPAVGLIIGLQPPQLLYISLVVALTDPDDEFYRDGENVHRKEWWQRDHVVAGYASSTNLTESSWDCLASAGRGNVERFGITTWVDRTCGDSLSQHYGFFQRAARIPPSFRPVGPELQPSVVQQLLSK